MADLAKSLRNILGREVDLATASYYELVGLTRDEPDMQVIETAFRATTLYLKNVREKSSVEEWNQVAQLVQQAKNTLLDPGKKVAYDAKLKRAMGVSSEPPNNPSTTQQPIAKSISQAATTIPPPAIEVRDLRLQLRFRLLRFLPRSIRKPIAIAARSPSSARCTHGRRQSAEGRFSQKE